MYKRQKALLLLLLEEQKSYRTSEASQADTDELD
jgi:hypothetical protein